jgi:hypothetical protein
MEDTSQAQLKGKKQLEEYFVRWMQRRNQTLEPVTEGVAGYQSSEGSIAKQSKQSGELIDMETASEKFSHYTGIGNNRRIGGKKA